MAERNSQKHQTRRLAIDPSRFAYLSSEGRLHVLVTGATGLIGSAVVSHLVLLGHHVTGISRGACTAKDNQTGASWIALDISRQVVPEDWLPHLRGVDAVVNCAGALQAGPSDDLKGVHAVGIAALFAACEQLGIRRVVHFSAIGVDRAAPTDFSRTKLDGDQMLMARDLDWVILRPAVVLGRATYGAGALMRALAALPLLPVMPNTGPLQVVQLDEVVETVAFFLGSDAPGRVALEIAGPERLSFADVVLHYRRWRGDQAPRIAHLPEWVARLTYALGDFAGLLGWRPPVRSTARREIARGAVGDPEPWSRMTGIVPRSLSAALGAEPVSVQERWFAPMYLLKPFIFVVLATFWIITGILSVGPSYERGVALMLEGGAGPLSGPSVIAGGVADLLIGIGIGVRRFTRPALIAALALSLFYVVAGTFLLPRLWLEPLGPLTKIWPIMILNLAALAILKDR
jgi:uncharacterized protein YbjT (DUF2867 family)